MLMKSNESAAIFSKCGSYGCGIKEANVGNEDKTFPSNRGVDPNILDANSFHP